MTGNWWDNVDLGDLDDDEGVTMPEPKLTVIHSSLAPVSRITKDYGHEQIAEARSQLDAMRSRKNT